MIKAIIIDDERGSIDALLWELETFKNDIEVITTFQSPLEALKSIKSLQFDLLFLDIQMPEMNGFEFLKSLENINFNVIFTTAFDQYAVKAFKVNAIDYLLKPIDEEELGTAIQKIKETKPEDNVAKQLELLFHSVNKLDGNFKTIIMPTSEGLEFIEVEKISHCHSDSNYTYIHRVDEKPLLIAKTLKEVEEMLEGKGFHRIHHSYLVNIRFIKKYNKGKAGSLSMKDGTVIPISRSRKKDFLGQL